MTSTIDVYGHVIPNTDLFNSAWYIYEAIIILTTIISIYLICALVAFVLMQHDRVSCGLVTLILILSVFTLAIPSAMRWLALLYKSRLWMGAVIVADVVNILYYLVRIFYGPSVEELMRMEDFAHGEVVTLSSRIFSIGSAVIEIVLLAIMISEVNRLSYEMGVSA